MSIEEVLEFIRETGNDYRYEIQQELDNIPTVDFEKVKKCLEKHSDVLEKLSKM